MALMTDKYEPPPGAATKQARGGLYLLSLIDLESVATNKQSEITKRFEPREFAFPVSPNSISHEEHPAVHIRRFQDGGAYVEEQGLLVSEISVRGSTGFRPNKKGSGVLPVFGLNDLTKWWTDPSIPQGERTGLQDLTDLRNLFRNYWAAKRDPAVAGRIAMAWYSWKDGEGYIVVPKPPVRFARDTRKKFAYEYDFRLETLQRLDRAFQLKEPDDMPKLTGLAWFLSRVAFYRNALMQSIAAIRSNVDWVSTIATFSVDLFLGTANDVLAGLTSIVDAGARAIGVATLARQTIDEMVRKAKDFVDPLRPGGPYSNALAAYRQSGLNIPPAEDLSAFRDIIRIGNRLLGENALFSSSQGRVSGDRSRPYQGGQSLSTTLGGRSGQSQQRATGARESSVRQGETIQGVARRLLGNATRWREIVDLNRLHSPYLSPSGNGVDVLRPGDPILYPAPSGSASNVGAKAYQQAGSGNSPMNQLLGVDLAVQNVMATAGSAAFDLVIQGGDLAVVGGTENMTQAITMRVNTEPGELTVHPTYGIQIGSRVKLTSMTELVMAARASFAADRRVEDVTSFAVSALGHTMKMKIALKLKGEDQALSLEMGTVR